jgi:hypothetical protein
MSQIEINGASLSVTLAGHTHCLVPGSYVGGRWVDTDLSGEAEDVREAASALWTPTVIAAFKSDLATALRIGQPATIADIEAERERRLAAGFSYDFGDDRGTHHIGTTAGDMTGWDDVTKLANALVAIGDTATTILISTDTGAANVTGIEWQHILIAAGAFRQPIWQASFALERMDPVPADVTDDQYWP